VRDRLRPFTRLLFLVVLVVAIILSFVQPSVFLGVLAGLAVALLCALFPYEPLGRRARIAVTGVAIVVLVIVVVAVAASGGSNHSRLPPTQTIQLGTTFETIGRYTSKTKALDVTDRLTIDAAELAKATGSPLLSPSSRRGLTQLKLGSALTAGLRNQGWSTKTTRRGLSATRTRTVPVKQHTVVPGLSENMLPVAKPTNLETALRGASGVQALPISFAIRKGSVTLDAPRYAIASTTPSSAVKQIPSKRDSHTITLRPTTRQVAFEVRSKVFRNAALAKVTDATKWTPFKWLVGLALALSNGAVRDRIVRVVKRGSRAKAEA
jgi:hypothetical protein